MRPEDRDAGYLWDMLDAATAVADFMSEVRAADYVRDRKLQLAVERAIEIIGEAARRVSDAVKTSHPEIPWQKMVAQRNVLAHEYGEIKQERIWLVATTHIPELVRLLKPLLPPSSDSLS